MATYIHVNNQAPNLLGRNRADAAANRMRADERLWMQGQAREQAAAQVQAKPVDYAHRNRPQRADEAAATGIQSAPLGHLWWFTKSEPVINTGNYSGFFAGMGQYNGDIVTGYARTSRLYCGDGSQYIEFTHGQTPQTMIPASSSTASSTFYGCVNAFFDFVPSPTGTTPVLSLPHEDNAKIVVLPVGKDVSVVLFVSYQWSYSINSTLVDYSPLGEVSEDGNILSFTKVQQNSLVRRCFVVSNFRIRELNAPPAFASCLEALLPAPTEVSGLVDTAWRVGPTNINAYETLPVYAIADLNVEGVTQGVYGVVANPATPGIFAAASQVLSAWSDKIGSLLKPFPSAKSWLVEDTSSGAYTPANGGTEVTTPEFFVLDLPRKYGKWNTANETPTPTAVTGGYEYDPTLFTPQPNRTFLMRPGRPALPEGFDREFSTSALRVVWDWDDPVYCRQVCLALGFNAADLVP